MKSVINPKYAASAASLTKIANGNYTPEHTFCNRRNVVELVTVDGQKMVVKSYRKVGWINGVIYTLFRKTKARRAYEHAMILLDNGIPTPTPVAYFEKRRFGIFNRGYFIAEYLNLPATSELFHSTKPDSLEHGRLALALSRFTLDLHNKGIVPLDYNTTNLLFEKVSDNFKFYLIDINRMKFGKKPGIKLAMKSFLQLGTYPDDYINMLTPYVTGRGFDFEDAVFALIRQRRSRRRFLRFKRFFKPNKIST